MRIDPVIVKERDTIGQMVRGLDNGVTAEENMAPEGTAGQPLVSNGTSEPPSYQGGVGTLAYGFSILVDMKMCDRCKIIVTDQQSFTIEAPSNIVSGPLLIIDIVNKSGDTTGAISFDRIYKLSNVDILTGEIFPALTANLRRNITFYHDGTEFIELGRSGYIVI